MKKTKHDNNNSMKMNKRKPKTYTRKMIKNNKKLVIVIKVRINIARGRIIRVRIIRRIRRTIQTKKNTTHNKTIKNK